MTIQSMGHKKWVIPDMYTARDDVEREIPSHETVCFTNTGSLDAKINMIVLFEDERKPLFIKDLVVKAQKSFHLRLDWSHLMGGVVIPKGVPYSLVIESDQKIVVEYSRLNWIHGDATTFGLMGYYED